VKEPNQGTESWEIEGKKLLLHHLDKVFWPVEESRKAKGQAARTKGDMCRYYRKVAPYLLPYLKDRPVTLRIFPEGIHGFNYYRRSLPKDSPSWIQWTPYEAETKKRILHLPLLEDLPSLLWFADRAAIELHIWGAKLPDLGQPDIAVFDLDVGERVSPKRVLEAVICLGDLLKEEGKVGYPKTSGGTGMHVFVPLGIGQSFSSVREWVKGMGAILEQRHPSLIALARGKTHRDKLVRVDYAQNSKGRNTAAPFTLRARPGAPVSMPLTWEEVEEGGLDPLDFNIASAPERLQKMGDPWKGWGGIPSSARG
jgi:bifunctional non-homologous end joining protein LigD